MRRSGITSLLATLGCTLALATPSASAVEYFHHVGIGGGGNAFGPFVTVRVSETVGYGQGLGCAGIRSIAGVVCESRPGEFVALVLGGDVRSEPYIHNHSTFESFFNGYYYP
ncbi:MAG TPA: hypothetical protein VNV44_05135 [Solirubrobacteraceae bacterium]|nr:hypothetical protein [Solirubrobacteraceae bacterium]